jgi:hypothetical protein
MRPTISLCIPGALAILIVIAWASESPAQEADAEALFKQAVELADAGQFAAAADRFQASYRAEPALGTLMGLAMAEQSCGRVAAALSHYLNLLDLAHRTHDAEREHEAAQRAAGLEPSVPTLTVQVSSPLPRGSSVMLDDAPMPLLGKPVPVDPGTHSLVLIGAGGSYELRRFSVAAGARAHLELKVETPKKAEPRADVGGNRNAWFRGLGVVSGVMGTAAVATGAALWVQSNAQYGKASNMCPGADCQAYAHESIQSGRELQQAAGVCLAIGGITLATGVTLWMAGSRSEPQTQARLQAGPGTLQMVGVF